MAFRGKGTDQAEVLVNRQGRRPAPFPVILILVLAVLVILATGTASIVSAIT